MDSSRLITKKRIKTRTPLRCRISISSVSWILTFARYIYRKGGLEGGEKGGMAMIPRARSFRSINRRIISTNSTVFLPSRTWARKEGRREGRKEGRKRGVRNDPFDFRNVNTRRLGESQPVQSECLPENPIYLFIRLPPSTHFSLLFFSSPPLLPEICMEGKIEGSRGSKRPPISLIAALAKENRVSRSDESISVSWLPQSREGDEKERVSRTWIVFWSAEIDRWFRISPRFSDGSGFLEIVSDRVRLWKIKIRQQIVRNKWMMMEARTKRSINLFLLGCE